MMYLSSNGLKQMTIVEKQKSIKKSLESIKERVDLDSSKNENELELDNKVTNFLNTL